MAHSNGSGIMEAMCHYARERPIRMHMPGHKGRKAFPHSSPTASLSPQWAAEMLDELRALDMTESPGLDNLHYPTGCIRETEKRAEKVFSSLRTFFLVNGATSGIQASLLAVRMTLGSGTVLLPRNVHKSLVSAMAMSGLEPVFVWPEYDVRYGGYLPLDWPKVKDALDDYASSGGPAPRGVFAINPTYSGFARDFTELADQVHSCGMVFIVDEAHGAHFPVGANLPPTSLRTGADLVIHGAHKTTVAFTQTALLHVGYGAETRFPGLMPAVEESLRAVQTTSPSYILMASLQQAIDVLEKDGAAWVDRGTEIAQILAEKLGRIPGVSVSASEPCPEGLFHDPTKLLVTLGGLGANGPEAARFLVREHGVVPEMVGPGYVLMLVSGAHGAQDVDAVEKAFKELAARYPGPCKGQVVLTNHEMPKPRRAMELRDAFLSVSRAIPVKESLGKIAADTIVIYPPGSPLVTPGERIDGDVVEYILDAHKMGLNVLGRGIQSGESEMKIYCVESS